MTILYDFFISSKTHNKEINHISNAIQILNYFHKIDNMIYAN